ncbi:MAG: ABC transporter ATP-binding protein [Coriobacteriaceae bacterium]|jgi:oligopeptide transport system ATP-binding protein|nr:ABC transporter ATP-binding protein [Coriobacteriaceae bacterium]
MVGKMNDREDGGMGGRAAETVKGAPAVRADGAPTDPADAAGTAGTADLLKVENLKMYFDTPDGLVKAVDGVSFTLNLGETLGVVGESGSGKSVTAMSIMGLVPMPPGKIHGGNVLFKGQSLITISEKDFQKIRGNNIAMIFQDPLSSLNPVYRVGKQVGEGLTIHKGYKKKQAFARAIELLDLVGIPNAAERARDYPHQFSGGMRQRAMIAMALACDPEILIADEPTTALDVTIQAQILELMQSLQKRTGSAIIMITHDLGVVADMADRILVMYAGRPVEYGTTDEIFYQPLHPYTWGLMRSIPKRTAGDKEPLTPIKGNPPSLINLPAGCAFSPRCPYAQPRCHEEGPVLVELAGAHASACHFSDDPAFLENSPLHDDEDADTVAPGAVAGMAAPEGADTRRGHSDG